MIKLEYRLLIMVLSTIVSIGCKTPILLEDNNEKPNILFIMSDDHATNAISAYGSRLANIAQTPNIDRLASEGVLMENVFCSNSICTPSRAVIMTGLYSHKNGVKTLDDDFDNDRENIAKILQKSGYQTAILSRLSRRVYSIERHELLKNKAEELLLKNYFKNVTCIFGDGSLGMEYQAPFDRILISAAAEDIPQTLIKQLKYGGIMVLPVGFSKEEQILIKVRKDTDQTHYEEIFKVRFVPLVEGLQNIRNDQHG